MYLAVLIAVGKSILSKVKIGIICACLTLKGSRCLSTQRFVVVFLVYRQSEVVKSRNNSTVGKIGVIINRNFELYLFTFNCK
jgi:hypothetical protein